MQTFSAFKLGAFVIDVDSSIMLTIRQDISQLRRPEAPVCGSFFGGFHVSFLLVSLHALQIDEISAQNCLKDTSFGRSFLRHGAIIFERWSIGQKRIVSK
jgi:hypothetical protein